MASTVLAAMAATMSLTFIRTSWKSPLRTPNFGPIVSTNTLPTDEPTWLATFLPLRSAIDCDVEVLARHDLRGLADIFDQRDRDEAAFVVTDQERLPGIGAEVDLAAHHLLHGEVAGRHREFLELHAALLERARSHQVVGRHAPDVGLVALTDGRHLGGRRLRPEPERQRARSGRGEILPARQCRA